MSVNNSGDYFGHLRTDVLALVPECGAFLSDGEVLAIQELLLEVLEFNVSFFPGLEERFQWWASSL